MARSISSGLQTQIANDANNIAFLVEFNFSTPIRVTNFYRDVSYDSNSYEAGGNFVNVSASQETGEAQVHDLSITMSNVTSTIRDVVQGGNYIDKSVNVYIGFFNTDETLVDATTFFSGLIKSCSITETIDSSTVTIVVANHWANWNLKKGRHFTDESQQQVYSGDKGLEFADQTKDDIRWGND